MAGGLGTQSLCQSRRANTEKQVIEAWTPAIQQIALGGAARRFLRGVDEAVPLAKGPETLAVSTNHRTTLGQDDVPEV